MSPCIKSRWLFGNSLINHDLMADGSYKWLQRGMKAKEATLLDSIHHILVPLPGPTLNYSNGLFYQSPLHLEWVESDGTIGITGNSRLMFLAISWHHQHYQERYIIGRLFLRGTGKFRPNRNQQGAGKIWLSLRGIGKSFRNQVFPSPTNQNFIADTNCL